MGMTGALKLRKIVSNARNVLSIEAMAAAQALDFLAPLKTSKPGQAAYKEIRGASPRVEKDRVLSEDFARIAEMIRAGKLAGVLR
jgi:histidine ammonia-lyase